MQNLGPNAAQGVTLTAALPPSFIFATVTTTAGSCNGSVGIYCDLGSIPSGSATTVTIMATPSAAGAVQMTGNRLPGRSIPSFPAPQ